MAIGMKGVVNKGEDKGEDKGLNEDMILLTTKGVPTGEISHELLHVC